MPLLPFKQLYCEKEKEKLFRARIVGREKSFGYEREMKLFALEKNC